MRGLAAPDSLINALRGPNLVKLLTRSDPLSANRLRLSNGISEEFEKTVGGEPGGIYTFTPAPRTSPRTGPPQVDGWGWCQGVAGGPVSDSVMSLQR